MSNYSFKIILISLYFLLGINQLISQKINNNWLLGNQWGLNFNSQPPTFFQTPINFDFLPRINFCISDANGDILFYTNTDYTYNQFHQRGELGWLQSRDLDPTDFIIIPDPGSANRFYMFNREVRGLARWFVQYSVYNTEINDGLGGVEPNNHRVFLDENVTNCFIGAEGPSNSDYNWMITHERESSVFKAYKITPCGIEEPVHSDIGTMIRNFSSFILSNDYSTLAFFSTRYRILNLLKFDRETGKFYDIIELGDNYNFGRGMTFSPNNQYLYGDDYQNGLIQLDISTWNRDSIINSREMIFTYPDKSWFESMRMGPDKKIYLSSKTDYFSIMHDPNQKGSDINFEQKALKNPTGRLIHLSRNTIPQNTYDPFSFLTDTTICPSDSLVLHLTENQYGYYTYNGEKITSPLILKEAGTYEIGYVGSCTYKDSFEISVVDLPDLLADTLMCNIEDEIIINIDQNEYESVLWENGYTQFDRKISGPGTYTITVEKSGCFYYDTMDVNLIDKVVVPIQDTTLCHDQSLQIQETYPVDFFTWDDGYSDWQRQIDSSGTYNYRFKTGSCEKAGSFTVEILDWDEESIDSTICPGEYLIYNQDTIYPGSFYLDTILSMNRCPIVQKVYPVIDSVSLLGDTLEVTISSDETFYWHGKDYSLPGKYFHSYFTDYGCEIVDLLILKTKKALNYPNIVSGNGDGFNDVFAFYGEYLEQVIVEKFHIYDRYGNRVFSQEKGISLDEVKWDTKQINDKILSGVYTFILITNENGKQDVYSGNITLLR